MKLLYLTSFLSALAYLPLSTAMDGVYICDKCTDRQQECVKVRVPPFPHFFYNPS
jgi:hypothetical protein